jgi:hypothetical protein
MQTKYLRDLKIGDRFYPSNNFFKCEEIVSIKDDEYITDVFLLGRCKSDTPGIHHKDTPVNYIEKSTFYYSQKHHDYLLELNKFRIDDEYIQFNTFKGQIYTECTSNGKPPSRHFDDFICLGEGYMDPKTP